MDAIWQILIGLLTIYVLGLGVGPLLKYAQNTESLRAPTEAIQDKWAALTSGDEGGKILGKLERLAFFGAFWIDAPELKDVVGGKVSGRQSPEEITCFVNNIGMSLQFAACGAAVVERARQQGLGRELPGEWFTEDEHP